MSRLPKYTLGIILLFFMSSSLLLGQEKSKHSDAHSHLIGETNYSDFFKKYDVFTEDLSDEYRFLQSNDGIELTITYLEEEIILYLYKNDLVSEHYVSRSASGDKNRNLAVTMDGFTREGERASISLADDFLFGYFKNSNNEKIYIEPARVYSSDASAHDFVIFHEADILDTTPGKCGTDDRHRLKKRTDQYINDQNTEQVVNGGCLEVELAIASDYDMFQKYGSISGVENHTIGVINDVQTNYVDDFNDTLQYTIVEQFVSNCASCDPWTSSTDASALLNSFTNWGPSGFSTTHDMGELWTDRDLNGGTVGIAWLGSVCTGSRYHVIQDHTSNSDLIRVTVAHEMGHNFDATHDAAGSPFIMAPAVQNTDIWSSQSMNEINSFVNTIDPPFGCLSNCPVSAQPVVADFGSVEDFLCPGSSVQFFEQASGPVATYEWSFPGAVPSSSTEQNPVVSFPSTGSYTVTLTVTNGGSDIDSKTETGAITVGSAGQTIMEFEDFEDGTTGQWNVGGGQSWSISTESGVQYGENALFINNYSSGGQFDLESPVIDLLGHANPVLKLNYAYATRNGNSDSLVVYVSTDAGNTFQRVWGIEEQGNGNYATAPSTSSPFSPFDADDWCHGIGNSCLSIPLDGAAHEQEVVIRLRNKAFGGNNLFIDYLYVASDCYNLNPPITDFTADIQQGCDDLTVNFTDQSIENPVNWTWDFPGGIPSSSTEQNPTVYYDQPGTYSVQLTTSNPAGSDTETKTDYIFVEGTPTAFYTYSVSGRAVTFSNQTTDAFMYGWDFGDGNGSTQENPVHTYSQDGTYTVVLTASNNCNADTYTENITIATPPVAAFTASDTSGCEPFEVIFDANASQNTTAYSWEFPGGNPSSGFNVVETVTYDTAGVYDVMFVASNANGDDTILLVDYITVNPLPEASFIFTQNELMVEFFANAADYDDLMWNFGDGNTSTAENPIHTYSSEGTYNVELIAMNNCGNDTFSQSITVEEAVNASFMSDKTMGCVPLNVTFDASGSSGANSYAWVFEGGQPSISSMVSPTVDYDTPGMYDVTLIVSDGIDSDTLIMAEYITVQGPPQASFTQTINGRTVNFNSTLSDYQSVSWNFGDGNTSTEENPEHEYAADGIYTVTLEAYNNCDTVSVQEEISIATPPTANFTFSNDQGCEPLTVSFTNSSSANANEFVWIFEGGTPATSTMVDPMVTYNSEGTYDVQLIAISNGGSDTLIMTDLITVLPDPEADFDFTVDTLTVAFTNQSAHGNAYLWDFGDGNNSTEVDPVHTYASEGSYMVTLSVFNNCDTSTFTREIGTASLPQANFSVQGSPDGCAPFTVQYQDGSEGVVDSFYWEFEGGTPASSNEANPVVVYNQAGTYDVSLTVFNAAGDNMLVRQDYIEVQALATGDIIVEVVDTLTVEFEGVVMGNASDVRWEFGDGNNSMQEQVTYTYANSGIYEVLFIVNSDCGADTSAIMVTVGSTSVSNERFEDVRIFPNPAQSIFTIDNLPQGSIIRIFDPMERLVYEKQSLSGILRVNSSGWSSGMYYINITHEDQQLIRKMIIQQ